MTTASTTAPVSVTAAATPATERGVARSSGASQQAIGFIGLGVMGEPMCRHLVQKSGCPVIAFDLDEQALARLVALGARPAVSARDVAEHTEVVLLSLPSGEVVERVVGESMLPVLRAGQTIVDLSTSAVDTTRALAARVAERGAAFCDAPVARTRAAAEKGDLSVMVGAQTADFERIRPLLATFASEITLCGGIGCGQIAKILNNMVLFETVVALSEAIAIAERAGMDRAVLFETLTKGSADSFALRNHGLKAVLPGEFPARAFSVEYARKDLGYALKLAAQVGVDAQGARNVDALYQRAIDAGFGELYHPVIARLFERG